MPCWLGLSCVLTATRRHGVTIACKITVQAAGGPLRGRRDRRSASSCHAHISARSTSKLTGEANSGAAGTCAWRASSIWAHESQCTAGVTHLITTPPCMGCVNGQFTVHSPVGKTSQRTAPRLAFLSYPTANFSVQLKRFFVRRLSKSYPKVIQGLSKCELS